MGRVLGRDRAVHELAGDPGMVDQGKRQGAAAAGGPDEGNDHGVGHVEGVDQHPLALLEGGGETGQQIGQLRQSGIKNHAAD